MHVDPIAILHLESHQIIDTSAEFKPNLRKYESPEHILVDGELFMLASGRCDKCDLVMDKGICRIGILKAFWCGDGNYKKANYD